MKTATIYTAATLLLAAIVLAVVCAVLKEEPTGGLKTKAEDRQAALDEATNLMLGR